MKISISTMDPFERLLSVVAERSDSRIYPKELIETANGYKRILTALTVAKAEIDAGKNPYTVLKSLRKLNLSSDNKSLLEQAIAIAKATSTSSDLDRLKWMWERRKEKFSDWERDFAKHMFKLLNGKLTLTTNQQNSLNKMFSKYRVPFDAKV